MAEKTKRFCEEFEDVRLLKKISEINHAILFEGKSFIQSGEIIYCRFCFQDEKGARILSPIWIGNFIYFVEKVHPVTGKHRMVGRVVANFHIGGREFITSVHKNWGGYRKLSKRLTMV